MSWEGNLECFVRGQFGFLNRCNANLIVFHKAVDFMVLVPYAITVELQNGKRGRVVCELVAARDCGGDLSGEGSVVCVGYR